MLLVAISIAISVPNTTVVIPNKVNKINFFLKKNDISIATFAPMTIGLTPILCFVTILICKSIVILAKRRDTQSITNHK